MEKFAPSSTGLLAPLARWLRDEEVSEILMNQPQEIYIEKKGVLERHDVPELDVHLAQLLFQLIANESQQALSVQQPLLSASLQDGSRVQIVLPPTAKYPTLSIRRKIVDQLSLNDYDATDFYGRAVSFDLSADPFSQLSRQDKELIALYQAKNWSDFIRRSIEYKKNIVISGGTSSGKTTFLNACLQHISSQERVVVLEDTREITIPHPNQVSLLSSSDSRLRMKN